MRGNPITVPVTKPGTPPMKSATTAPLAVRLPTGIGPTFNPIWLCRNVDVNDPGDIPSGSGSVMLGFSSQFAVAELPTVFDTMAPNSRTGMRERDSTLVWDISST